MKSSGAAAGYRVHALPDFLPELERGESGGPPGCRLLAADRKTLIWAQRLEGDIPAVVKMNRHRGGISWQRGKCFRFRVQREFDALTFLDGQGVPCSRPIFWSYGCGPHFGRCEILATREIENATPLDAILAVPEPPDIGPALLAAYGLVRRMHERGCHHGLMFARNILVTRRGAQTPDAYIIDTPNAILFPGADLTGTKMAWIDLYFLTASVMKHAGAEACLAPLRHYGLGPGAIGKLVDHVITRRLSRLAKNLFRLECETWELAARVGMRCWRSHRLRG